MADRPILFSAPMVQALLAGRKTQTRRLLPNPEYYGCPTGDCPHDRQEECNKAMAENTASDLRFAAGDRLWVKETWRAGVSWDDNKPSAITPNVPVDYLASLREGGPCGKTRVSIFMPRWASRLTLTVTDVRVERLQDCSEADAIAEGVRRISPEGSRNDTGPYHFTVPIQHGNLNERTAKATYELLWNVINGPGAWEANPWVVAVSFDVHRGNIDQMPTPAPIEGGGL